MATLGSSTLGFSFSVSGSFGQAAGGGYTVPSPGIFVDQISVYAGNNGSSAPASRLYVWNNSSGHAGGWLMRSGATFSLGGLGWQQTDGGSINTGVLSSDGYLPAGTVIWIGINSSSGILNYQGAGSGTTDLGNTGDGDFNFHGTAGGGMGVLGAYVDYHTLAGPTLSSVTPSIGVTGTSIAVVGTNLAHATACTIGGAAASFVVNSDTSITATVPSGATPGVGTLTVNNPAGGASIAFTAGGIVHIRRSGGWVVAPVNVKRSGANVAVVVYVKRSGAWVVAS